MTIRHQNTKLNNLVLCEIFSDLIENSCFLRAHIRGWFFTKISFQQLYFLTLVRQRQCSPGKGNYNFCFDLSYLAEKQHGTWAGTTTYPKDKIQV